jgi:predicted O-methyltransferase YrrM
MMTDERLGPWLKNFADPIRRERIWKIGLVTGLRYDQERGYYPPNFERGLILDRLVELRRPKRVLEIGTGRGLGSFAIRAAARTYGCECQVETCDLISPEVAQEWAIEVDGRQEVRRASCAEIWGQHFPGWESTVRPRTGRTTKTLPALFAEGRQYDLIFIDAGHDLFAVAHDLAYSTLLLAPGGRILMDDFAPLEPFGLGTCVAAVHARRFFREVEIFPTEGLVYGSADVADAPRAMVLLSERAGVPRLNSALFLWWRLAGVVLDLCYRDRVFPLSSPPKV